MEKEYKIKSVEMISPKYELALKVLNKTVEEIEVPYGTKSIYHQFENNTNLKRVILPETLSYTGSGAFEGCTSLNYIKIPKFTNLPFGLFNGCTSLLEINYDGTMSEWNSASSGLSSSWNYGSVIERVICLDGTITL